MKILLLEKLREAGVHLKKRRGGLTMMELVASIVIITITSVAVASSFYTAYGELSRQRRRMYANQLLTAEAEFWKGRIHSAFPSPFEMQQVIPNPNNPIPLDPYSPGGRQVLAEVFKAPIRSVDIPETQVSPDWYEIRVWITYEEPNIDRVVHPSVNDRPKPVMLELVVPFIPSTM